MYKGLVFIGPSGSGKTSKARQIASLHDEKNVTWIDGKSKRNLVKNDFRFASCHENTELIIIDDVISTVGIGLFYEWITSGVWVHAPGSPSFQISPKLIIIYDEKRSLEDFDKVPSTLRRFDFIDFSTGVADHLDITNAFTPLIPVQAP